METTSANQSKEKRRPVNLANPDGSPRTYLVRTLGCQMNVHDSERIAGLLEESGLVPVAQSPAVKQSSGQSRAGDAGDMGADVVVINTCSVRENAANRLFGNLGQLAAVKRERPDMQIAVGGCLAQQMREGIVERAPWVDAVFGTHNIDVLPALLSRAAHNQRAAVEIEESLKVFPSNLPTRRESPFSAWVAISVGCNNTCTFCIVPTLRGREVDRTPEEILAEVEAVVAEGAIEVTLLGQNVNSYGASFRRKGAFADLLREVGATPGLERLRFTSPHPAAFTDDVIDAMAETPTVMPSLHMPLQSGSDKVLREMRRSYRVKRFDGILERVRARMPEAAITTDIIVGFPGETEEDFQQTLDTVERSRFASAFTFLYSPRPGTPAAERTDIVPHEIQMDRYNRLIEVQKKISWEENRNLVGTTQEVLVGAREGRKDGETHRLSGRAPDGRLVHFTLPDGIQVRPGDLVDLPITYAAPHHLLSDAPLDASSVNVRRTRAGDAWEARTAPRENRVALGMPTLRVRA